MMEAEPLEALAQWPRGHREGSRFVLFNDSADEVAGYRHAGQLHEEGVWEEGTKHRARSAMLRTRVTLNFAGPFSATSFSRANMLRPHMPRVIVFCPRPRTLSFSRSRC